MKQLFWSFLVIQFLVFSAFAQKAVLPTAVSTLADAAGHKGSVDGVGMAARFNFPHSIAVAADGVVYVANMNGHTIRKIAPDGTVSTLARVAGQKGSADGTGAAARFRSPAGMALDAAGIIYVADAGNHTIRKISPAGEVATLAGTVGSKGSADGSGTLYVADTYSHTIRQITPAGVVITLAGQAGHKGQADGSGAAASFFHPAGLVIGAQGTVYVADNGSHTIRCVTAVGKVSTLARQAGHHGSADGQGSNA